MDVQRRKSLLRVGFLLLNLFLGGTTQRGMGRTYATEIEWTRTYGGADSDGGSAVQQTVDGE